MGGMRRTEIRQLRSDPGSAEDTDRDPDLIALLARVARGDHQAFELLYGELAGPVYGVVRQVLRDPAQSEDQQAAVVSARGMRSLPSAQTYQLWVIGPHGARSAGLLSGTGRAGPVLASGVEPGDRIGITVEPAGGTSSPTTTPVIAVPV